MLPATPLVLRPYQQRDVGRLRHSYASGHRAPLYVLPTGAGKTVVFAEITRGAQVKRTPTLIVVPRRELVRQASDKLSWAGVPHGIIAEGFAATPGALVQIGSIYTLVNRLARLPEFGLHVIDEAHHSCAGSWRRLREAQPQAKLLGVTATPYRFDGQGLGIAAGGLFDELVIGPSIAELVAQHYLAPSQVYAGNPQLDLSGVARAGGDYVATALARVVDNKTIIGDAVAHYRRYADHRPAIAFCVTVAHAEHVAELFGQAGYRAACVHGDTPTRRRDALIAGLADGTIEILTNCDLISEGLDVPMVSAVLLMRPTESLSVHMQQLGRGMRYAEGKTLIVLDHVRNCTRHGLPDSERIWSLDGHVVPGFADPPSEPHGGGIRQPKEAPGELLALETLDWAERLGYWELHKYHLPEATLFAIARRRGYKPGWVYHMLREQRTRRQRN